jgi:hypothetical protein
MTEWIKVFLPEWTLGVMGLCSSVLYFAGSAFATPQDMPALPVTQNWDQILPADDSSVPCNSSRFTCVLPDSAHPQGAAVRDNETGLVWDISPDPVLIDWFDAIRQCANREVGGRKGWHLPMREQLASLVDTSNGNPTLPTGHPFQNIESADFWTASTQSVNPEMAWDVRFSNGMVGLSKKIFLLRAWCVRGGQSFDGQDVHSVIKSLP